jgi:hypothetical protein
MLSIGQFIPGLDLTGCIHDVVVLHTLGCEYLSTPLILATCTRTPGILFRIKGFSLGLDFRSYRMVNFMILGSGMHLQIH